ncbi:Uncharacterized protein Y057_9052 [Fusarium fujikuroi]|nr:Uncharacterized protein Y057_9052 [Fusarium fujikuroi]
MTDSRIRRASERSYFTVTQKQNGPKHSTYCMTDIFLYSSCRAQSCRFQETVCTLEVGPCKSPANPGACIPKFCAKLYVKKKTETQASCIVSLHLKSQSARGKLNNLLTYLHNGAYSTVLHGRERWGFGQPFPALQPWLSLFNTNMLIYDN